jgi:hypothetical protein
MGAYTVEEAGSKYSIIVAYKHILQRIELDLFSKTRGEEDRIRKEITTRNEMIKRR